MEDHVEEVDVKRKGNVPSSSLCPPRSLFYLSALHSAFWFVLLHVTFHSPYSLIRLCLFVYAGAFLPRPVLQKRQIIILWLTLLTRFFVISVTDNFYGMGKEVENLIMENNELLATKSVCVYEISSTSLVLMLSYKLITGTRSILSRTI